MVHPALDGRGHLRQGNLALLIALQQIEISPPVGDSFTSLEPPMVWIDHKAQKRDALS
jgi:hypothetical protein